MKMMNDADTYVKGSGGAGRAICIRPVSVWAVSGMASSSHLTAKEIRTYSDFGKHERNGPKSTFFLLQDPLE